MNGQLALDISNAPAYRTDIALFESRRTYDFRDYGLELRGSVLDTFHVVATRADDEELFLVFFPKRDVAACTWALLNLHVFLKRTGSVDAFIDGFGLKRETLALQHFHVFGKDGVGYERILTMRELFATVPQVIDFVGGDASVVVRDSHIYFAHRHTHAYTGMLHLPGQNAVYDSIREDLFRSINLV